MSKPTNAERSQCHGRPRSSDGHEPWELVPSLSSKCKHCHRAINNVLGAWLLSPGESLTPKPEKQYVFIDAAGQIANCDRCGATMRVADRRNKDSHPFKLAEKPKGFCANCVMTQFLYNVYPINLQIDEAGPEMLLKSGIREAFLSCGMMDHCDLNIDEVNWAQVVANWSLPVKVPKDPTNPYRMGDSPKSHLKPKVAEPEPPSRDDVWAALKEMANAAFENHNRIQEEEKGGDKWVN